MDRPNVGTARIIRADSRALPLADNSVDLVVTSPPYFGLRSYQDGGEHYAEQIGAEATPAEFIAALLEVTRECVRVLKPSGSIFVNLGDRYSGGTSGDRNNGFNARSGNAEGKKAQELAQKKVAAVDGMRPKSLIGIPWRYAIACIDQLGLILRAEIIWDKPNGLPESVTDRVRRSHEQWFHFTVQPRYYSAIDNIRETYAPGTAARYAKGYNPTDYQTGQVRKDIGVDYSGTFDTNPLGKLPGSVWTIPTQPLKVPAELGVDHFAAFPMEWPRRIIRAFTPAGVCSACGEGRRPVAVVTGDGGPVARAHRHLPGYSDHAGVGRRDVRREITGERCACPDTTAPTTPGVVLDPFGGTGTTALVAKALGRDGISVDMSADYCRLAEWRTTDPGELARAMQVEKPAPELEGQADLFGDVA